MAIFNKKVFILLLSLALPFLLSAFQAEAATLSLLPEARTFGVGQTFSVDIKVNTEEAFINATQATIRFPNDILELVSADKADSSFGFWVEEPKISNEEGTLSFTGGTAKGISGESLQILKIKFKAKGAGFAELAVQNAAVTASDGKGTNVLSVIKGTNITIGTETVVPVKPVAAPMGGEPRPDISGREEPKKVIREPVAAKGLPKKPELRVPLYSDESRWYNHSGEVLVLWNVSGDVIEVAVALDKNPTFRPQKAEKELFTGKNFGILKEGIWYIHVRFRNNVGWGSTAHYKISIDTTAPMPFEIKMGTLTSDNPTPEVRYEAHDALSGISHALLFIDGQGLLRSTTTITTLAPQPPGKHTLLIRIFDLAGNSVEDDLGFEILPLPTPTIDFITKTVSQGEFVFISGKAMPNAFVDVRILNTSGREVFKDAAKTNGGGNWELIIKEPLDRGKYTLLSFARDERGATSLAGEAVVFRIKPKTVISLGFVDFGWFEILLTFLLLVTAGISVGAWYYISAKKTREAYEIIVGRDIEKLSAILTNDLQKVEKLLNLEAATETSDKTRALYLFKKLHETIAKMKKYLGEEVKKLK